MSKQHILVTTDFSPEAAAAFSVACRQAKLMGVDSTKITLLSVLEDLLASTITFEFGFALIDAEDIMRQSYERIVAKLKETTEQYFKGFSVEPIALRATKPVQKEILDYAKDHGVDLIIMATHGRSGFKHLVLGSITERIIREARCPVLVVPSKQS